MRNEFFVHLIYYCAVIPRFWRLYLHRACIEIGGLHSATACWGGCRNIRPSLFFNKHKLGTFWTVVYIADELGQVVKSHPEVFATGLVLLFFLVGMILTALPW